MDQKIEQFEEILFKLICSYAEKNGIEPTMLVAYMAKGLQELADIQRYKEQLKRAE